MVLSCQRGRIRLEMRALNMGNDWQIIVTGGAAHLGAIALGLPANDPEPTFFELPEHREGALAKSIAKTFAQELNCRVCVSAGIHFENISKEELCTVEEMANGLARQGIETILNARKRQAHG